jgi:hypothetical protein
MGPGSEAEQREGGKQESLFREVNERIGDLNQETAEREILCECSDRDCVERISVTSAEYEAVRSRATHFFAVPGHEHPELEVVVERNDRYVVVEKIGAASGVAVRNDPRSRSSDDAA